MSRKRLLMTWLKPEVPYVCRSCCLKNSHSPTKPSTVQRRWLTLNHAKRILEAEKDWQERAVAIRNGSNRNFLQILEERGLINQVVGPRDEFDDLLLGRRVGAYAGIDPTAPSMHVGHMVPFMALAWFYIHGYPATFLLGGSTSRIGDPTDRLSARAETTYSERVMNTTSMHMQLARLGQNIETYARKHGYRSEWAWHRALVNNHSWWQKVDFLDFMKGPGKAARVGPLLGRDFVKRRLEKGDGMTLSEFIYPLMQGYDWYKLYQTGTQIQIGGADQFGNILEGAGMVKKLNQMPGLEPIPVERPPEAQRWERKFFGRELSDDPFGFTVPLMTTSTGEKFGKSAGNGIWLDADMTSPFELYQYFLRLPDADVERFLKLFTFLPLSEISGIMQQHQADASKRFAHHELAFEFLYLVHGKETAELAQRQHKQLFSGTITMADILKNEESEQAPGEINPSLNKYAPQTNANNNTGTRIRLPRSLVEGQQLSKVLWSAGMVASKSEGHRLSAAGGAHIASRAGSNPAIGDSLSWTPTKDWTPEKVQKYLLHDAVLVFRIGKWKIKIVQVISDEEFERLGLSCPGWKEDSYSAKENIRGLAQRKGEWIKARQERSGLRKRTGRGNNEDPASPVSETLETASVDKQTQDQAKDS